MITLRDYQKTAVNELTIQLNLHRRVVGVSPTASGKTVIGAALIKRGKYRNVLWLAHRTTLLSQAKKQLEAAGLSGVGIWSGSKKDIPKAVGRGPRVLTASIGMFRDGKVPTGIDLVVIDECHHVAAATYMRVLQVIPATTKVLGLTATPGRLDGKPLGDAFDYMAILAEAAELMAEGHIMCPIVYAISRKKAMELVKGLPVSDGDYSSVALDKAMRKQPLMADIVKEWKRLAEGRPTVVYACTVDHATEIADRFIKAGVTAEVVDWSTPENEREAILGKNGRLAKGMTKVVCNVEVLTEGVDCPPIKCIVVARPTKSLTLWLQMCGRALRVSGKLRPIVLDHAGNVFRLKLPDYPHEWSLHTRMKVGDGDAPVRQCAECGAIGPASAKECAECGAVFPMSARELAEREGELERVQEEAEERALKEAAVRKMAKIRNEGEGWVGRVLAEIV
jgi:superfamily II DNA or RNA helicase